MNEERISVAFFKKYFPSLVSNEKVNLSLLRQYLGEDQILEEEHYQLQWTGKKESRRHVHLSPQSVIVPTGCDLTRKTLHVLIEGENLEALKILLPAYRETVKLIYIDPPYNTGNTSFVYQDRFTVRGKRTKPDSHSGWLSMMYERLTIAKDFLRTDGVLLISIDENEVAHLKLLGDELFGEDNFVGKFVWINRTTPNDAKCNFATDHEYILIFAKDKAQIRFKGVEKDLSKYKNPDNDHNGEWCADNPSAASGSDSYKFAIVNPYTGEEYFPPQGRFWAFSPQRVQEWTESGKLVFPKEKGKNFLLKKYKKELRSERKPVSSVIRNILTTHATKELKALFQGANPFKFAKPLSLIKFFIEQLTDDGDLILDFFAGSGTTTHATMLLNKEQNTRRKSISIQVAEPYEAQETQLNQRFRFVSDVLKERIDRVISLENNNSENFSYKWFTLKTTHALNQETTEHASLYRLLLHKKYPLDVAIEKVVFRHSYYYRVEDTAIVFEPFPDEMVACWHETGISELFVNRAVLPEKELPSRLKNIRVNVWQ